MSARRTPVQIEAPDEQRARNSAALRYDLGPRNGPAPWLGAFVWRMPALVTVEPVDSVVAGIDFIASGS
jgi:hypothetical protein